MVRIWLLHLHYPFVPTVMQNVPLNLPSFWRAGILIIAYKTVYMIFDRLIVDQW